MNAVSATVQGDQEEYIYIKLTHLRNLCKYLMSFSLTGENESLGLMGIEVLHLLESLQVQKR